VCLGVARAERPVGAGDAGQVEEVGGASVPAGAVHAADEVEIGRVDIVLGGVEDEFVVDVHGENAAEDEAADAALSFTRMRHD